MSGAFRQRRYLVDALAPESLAASRATDALNAYIEDRAHGTIAFHDHFARSPHGGLAVFDLRTQDELAMLDDAGPLDGCDVHVHALTCSLSIIGFVEQTHRTLREHSGMSVDALRDAEPDDPRFWWR